ncbi:MAG: hypothetical protein BWY71_02215 [Planctomycetes bacterium ADurb.Bin412]|nr:MAG: hypothetical protein BWY71_02215 [Planctomycetes bacterium ADurb.Bin412]
MDPAAIRLLGIQRPAKPLQHPHIPRVHNRHAAHQIQHQHLNHQQRHHRPLQQLVKPRLRDLKTKLVIDRMRRRPENPARLAEQPQQPRLIRRPTVFPPRPRPVRIQNHTQDNLQSDRRHQHQHRIRDYLLDQRILRIRCDQGNRQPKTNQRIAQQIPAPGPQRTPRRLLA